MPPLSGFFSKDEILWEAFAGHGAVPAAAVLGYVTAAMTAFYMGRLLFLTFFGACRASHDVQHHLHESPAVMTLPLVALAVLAAVGGFIPIPEVLAPVLGHHEGPHAPGSMLVLATGLALGGLGFAWFCYVAQPELPARVAAGLGGLYRLVHDKWRIDELYDATVVRLVTGLAGLFAWVLDPIIDGTAVGSGRVVAGVSSVWRRAQTGNVQHYALSFLAGALALIGYYVLG